MAADWRRKRRDEESEDSVRARRGWKIKSWQTDGSEDIQKLRRDKGGEKAVAAEVGRERRQKRRVQGLCVETFRSSAPRPSEFAAEESKADGKRVSTKWAGLGRCCTSHGGPAGDERRGSEKEKKRSELTSWPPSFLPVHRLPPLAP